MDKIICNRIVRGEIECRDVDWCYHSKPHIRNELSCDCDVCILVFKGKLVDARCVPCNQFKDEIVSILEIGE